MKAKKVRTVLVYKYVITKGQIYDAAAENGEGGYVATKEVTLTNKKFAKQDRFVLANICEDWTKLLTDGLDIKNGQRVELVVTARRYKKEKKA